ncbi:MAG: hypothetical protein DI569_09215 [Sphingopyxis macrogoltabida]|uniref:DUF2029 domain-containing protein n=1 Tax=Sphingopyxis macrogoltabida TaxID=33050 RepID=A0A2W5MQS6_SPHMC|nr:MAG: hypothetical protein DI569_09215 [Sphingopyxis macrogoltabida]
MTERSLAERIGLIVEYLFMLGIIVALGHMTWYFIEYGYLRQPFFYEPSGTWMDWFALSRYAHIKGAYDVELTIYPPLSFVFMKIFSISQCYHDNFGEEVRECDWLGMAFVCFTYVCAVVLTFWHFYKFDKRTFLPRAFAIAFGFPMLYGFERGNLVIIAFIFYVLAFGYLLKSARLRWICAGFVINLKVYMIAPVMALLVRRRWVQVEAILISTLVIYVLSWLILGEGSPAQIVGNITYYSSGFGAQRILDLWYSSSLIPLRTLMESEVPIYAALSSEQVEYVRLFAISYTYLAQGLVLLALAATWLRPEVVPPSRLLFFGAIFALSSSEAGGYTGIFLLFSIYMERWKGIARPAAIVLAYIICIPDDIIIPLGMPPLIRDSFLGNREVAAYLGIGPLSIFRPILMFTITILLASFTIRQVWVDIRQQGWKDRWRYRRDLPLFPGVLRPRPATAAGGESKVDG